MFHVHASVALHSTEYLVLTKATILPTSDSVGYSLAACSEVPNTNILCSDTSRTAFTFSVTTAAAVCGRQGTSGGHPRVSCRDRDIGV